MEFERNKKNAISCCISIVLFAIVVCVWIMVTGYANHKNNETGVNKGRSLTCFECLFFKGYKWTHQQLPFEDECEKKPFNHRLCRQYEICHFGKLVSHNRTRVQRSCYDPTKEVVQKQLGCITSTGSVNYTWCFCDDDLC